MSSLSTSRCVLSLSLLLLLLLLLPPPRLRNQVFFCSASPAIRYPNVYGIDMPVQAELIAYGRNEKEIAQAISADWVVYQVKPGRGGIIVWTIPDFDTSTHVCVTHRIWRIYKMQSSSVAPP